jgi:hypothetical protein
MLSTRNITIAALLVGTTIATGVLAASPNTTGCPSGVQRTEGEGGTAYSAKYGVQKTEGEGGTAYSAAHGVQKTEGEGGTAYSAKYGVQKTEGERTDYYAVHRIQKSEGSVSESDIRSTEGVPCP